MRKVALVTAIALAVLVWVTVNPRWFPQPADAALPIMVGAMTAYDIEATIDVQALPELTFVSDADPDIDADNAPK